MIVTILKKYIWVVNLIILTGIAYVLALAVTGEIENSVTSNYASASTNRSFDSSGKTNTTAKRHKISYYNIIEERNIFGIKNTRGSAGTSGSVAGPGNLPPLSSLNIELLGTILHPDSKSVAIIKNPDTNKVQGYRNGEEIKIISSAKFNLVEVRNCRAVIESSGQGRETIKCKSIGDSSPPTATRTRGRKTPSKNTQSSERQESDGITKISDNEYEISRELLEDVLSDPTSIMKEARVIPQSDGLRFFGIRSSSIFWKIGIKNGDIMHSINNVGLNDVEKALGVFEELRAQSYFTIDFTRGGEKYTYEYTVK